jgi:hypothetical protein
MIETDMRATIMEKEITVTAPVLNNSLKTILGELSIELLDPKDAVVASFQSAEELKPGKNSITAHLLLNDKNRSEAILWHRLRYRFTEKEETITHGIVALGVIAPEMFELRIVHARNALPGKPYTVRVHAAHPITNAPVSGVRVHGDLSGFDSTEKTIVIDSITNSLGDAVLLFQIPKDAKDEGNIKIEAQKGNQTQKSNFSFELDPQLRIIINTDKLLYQPGQLLHARALVLSLDRHAIAHENVEFKLQDSEDKTLLIGASRTNDFGIAGIDWKLPDSVELGDYGLQVSFPDNVSYEAEDMANIRISRYDLPDFAVNAKPGGAIGRA